MSPSRRFPGTEPIVLVVDDDVDARRMYSDYLRAKGWTVYSASDGRAGIDKANELKPDAIVLDLAMPKVDGWTVLSTLRSSSWTAPIRVVVVTALDEVRDEAMREGADACLTKPCPPDVLWLQVRALIHAREHPSAAQAPVL